jgi:hypothetical protein
MISKTFRVKLRFELSNFFFVSKLITLLKRTLSQFKVRLLGLLIYL